MPSKIIWLALLFTLVYWLGNAGGCASQSDNQNYQLLDEDRPMFDTKHDASKPGASIAPETAPSVNGIDRSHWARIATGPEQANIAYQPHYFEDLPLDATPARETVMHGPDAVVWDPINTKATLLQPIKFGVDFMTLPVKMMQDPVRVGQLRIASGWKSQAPAEEPAATEDATTTTEPVPADGAS